VTDGNGRATLIYTAPPAPAIVVTNGTIVSIEVTPTNSGDAANSNTQAATIRLVPPGIIPAPVSPLVPSFTPPSLNVGDQGVFTAKVVDNTTGADVTNQIASFRWDFGDGATATGRSVTHTFALIGTFPVTLTITDALNRTNFITQSITIGQGQLPTASFVASPASPVVNQTINFNASGSQAAPGHTIVDFAWTFGDGSSGNGAIVTHAYTNAGSYTVTLQTTDDAGRKSTLISQTISVTTGLPIALITVSPPSGKAPVTISFIGSQSTVAPGRTIVSYHWDFGDGTSGSGPTTSHLYTVANTYTVTLIVTDDQGNSGIATATVTIQ
jgi:PKD repeat protein